jgi:hypothetical protein
MKMQLQLLALLLTSSIGIAAESDAGPAILTPAEIIKNGQLLKNGMKKVIVRFEIGSIMTVPTIYPDDSKHQVFHLVPSGVDAKFTAPITPQFLAQLTQIGIADIKGHFEGKTVTLEEYVSGTATMIILPPTVWTYHMSI